MKKLKNNILTLFILISIFSFSQEKQLEENKQLERFEIKSININNKFQNFGTTFFGNNRVIYSSQNKEGGELNLYVGTVSKDGEILAPRKLEGLDYKRHESNVVFTQSQKKVYFSRSTKGISNTVKKTKDKQSRIAICSADVLSTGKWANVEELSFGTEMYDIGHPSINKSGTKMYFTSNMKGTLGSTDIFVVAMNNGSFGTPKNLGPKVNSPSKEMFSHIDENNVLFFSSARKDQGYGGLDIYAVKIYENGEISDRLHLEPPINSSADDFNYIFDDIKKEGYFSSNRKGGKGSDDIYFFKETRPLVFDCYQEINGVVVDATTKNPIPYAIVTLKDANGKFMEKITTKKDGKFSFTNTVCDVNYQLVGEKIKYGQQLEKFTTKNKHKGSTIITIPLADSFIVRRRGKRMLDLNIINFDFNSAEITPHAANSLIRVVNVMKRYPRMEIALGTHTDTRGKDLYNLVLSNKRATSVINYIIDHGIAEERISGRGYGEKKLLNHCKNGVPCSAKEHEENRRSEFVITKI